MAQTNIGRVLKAKVEERINDYALSLASGAAADYPSYRHSVGMLQGMREAMNILDDIEKEKD